MKARVSVKAPAPRAVSTRSTVSAKPTITVSKAAFKAVATRSFKPTSTQVSKTTSSQRFSAPKTTKSASLFTSTRAPKLFSAPRFISLDATAFNAKTENVFFQQGNDDTPTDFKRSGGERDILGNRETQFGEDSVTSSGSGDAASSARVYVGNVPYKATNDQIKEFFTKAGFTVESIRMAQDPTGRARGWGIVQLGDESQAKKAIEALDHTTMLDRQILVRQDKNTGERRSGGGSGYYGDRSGGEGRPRRDYSFDGAQREGGRAGGYGGSRGGYRERSERSFGGDRSERSGGRGQRDFGGERDQGGLGGDREGFGRGGYNTNTENKFNDHQQNEMVGTPTNTPGGRSTL